MSSDPFFDDLMARLKSGEKDAASKVFHRFAWQLIALARQELDTRLQQKMDPEDVLQSVFRSFFAHQAAGDFDLGSWNSIWGILVVMTLRKCHRKNAYFFAERRDVRREVPFTHSADGRRLWEPYDREPTPAEAAALTETVHDLLNEFEGRSQQIVTLFLQGYNAPEISSHVGCTERTVYRINERVKELLHYRCGE
jgi:RNA polymerase sigma-70 factor (ECF subfamily)